MAEGTSAGDVVAGPPLAVPGFDAGATPCDRCGNVHGHRVRHVKVYGRPVSERIAECQSMEELTDVMRAVFETAAARGTKRKWLRLGFAKAQELKARLIVVPERRLVVPRGGLEL